MIKLQIIEDKGLDKIVESIIRDILGKDDLNKGWVELNDQEADDLYVFIYGNKSLLIRDFMLDRISPESVT